MVDSGKTSNTIANQKIFPALMNDPKASPKKLAQDNNWIQESNSDALSEFIEEALQKFPEKVEEYKAGKKGLMGLFMGEVMKSSKGKADPKMASQLLKEKT